MSKDILKREINKLIDIYWPNQPKPPEDTEELEGHRVDDSSSYKGDMYIMLPDRMIATEVRVGGTPAVHREYKSRPSVQFWYVRGLKSVHSGELIEVISNGTKYIARVGKSEAPSPSGKVDTGKYRGRTNGDRATFYFPKRLREYPSVVRIEVPGYTDRVVDLSRGRYEKDGILLKQSDVRGRGMALLVHRKYKGKTAKVHY